MDINVNVKLSAEPALTQAIETIANAVAACRILSAQQTEEAKTGHVEVPRAIPQPEADLEPQPEPQKAESSAEEPQPEPKPKKRKAAPKKAEEPKDEPKAEEPTPEVSRADVIALGKKLVKNGKTDEVISFMKEKYDVSRFSDVPDQMLPEVYAAFKEMEA